MAADLLALLLVLAMTLLGWYRGTLVQIVTVVIAVLLLVFFDAWFPPLEMPLAQLAMPLAEYPYLRKLVAFLLAYIGCVTVVAMIEVATRDTEAEQANRIGGVVIGALKGLLYVAALAWFVETVTLWDKPPHEPAPSWMRDSLLMTAVGPWNPVRVYTLKEAVELKLARAELAERERAAGRAPDGGEALDEAAAAATPDGQPAELGREEGFDVIPLEESSKARQLYRASPVRALMDETASLSEWQGRGYGDMVRDPRVREILGDANIADLLMGE
ncbi:MAG: CvpA family protein [Deltaproteobacteria bacterium]|nr:CvpA family protein [Deltaproteobacteria bacterium]